MPVAAASESEPATCDGIATLWFAKETAAAWTSGFAVAFDLATGNSGTACGRGSRS